MDAVDRVMGRMRPLLLLQAAGFFAWQAGDGVATADSASREMINVAIWVSMAGAATWIIAITVFFYLAWKAKQDGIYDIMQDEWAQHVRKRAAEAAFWVLTVCTVVTMTISKFGVEASMLLQLNVGVSVAGYFLATVWFDTRSEAEE